MSDLTTQNTGLEALIKQVLDKVSAMEVKVDGLQEQLTTSTKRADAFEARLEEVLPPLDAAGKQSIPDAQHQPPAATTDSDPVPQLPRPQQPSREAAPSRPSASDLGFGSADHGDAHLRRSDARGLLANPMHAPVTGNPPLPSTHVHARIVSEKDGRVGDPYMVDTGQHRGGYHSTPKMEFPKFDGENPKVWQDECETYFEIYQVSPDLRTRFAALNFRGTAALWWRNVQAKGRVETWPVMCNLVHEKFGKNKYVHYRRQLRALKQTGTVSEYLETFETLHNQMLLYNAAIDEGFFVDEFLDGLREEIRSAIHLHRPSNLDTASHLALLQEEELESMQRKYSSRQNYKEPQRYGSNFSSTPDKITKDTASTGKADDGTRTEHTKWEDKLDTLKSYRRSKGLCFTCGEKWNHTHKCPAHVPLHVIEELLELLPITNSKSDLGSDTEDNADEVLLISSVSPPNKATKKATIRLHGVVGKRQINILVDSGSVSSFISTSLATELGCDIHESRPETFKVADGRAIQCTQFVPGFEWGVQGHTFRHSVNVLNLGCYDMILGADWLDLHSPMWVHWRKKILWFTHNNRRITLRGVQSTSTKCGPVKLKKLQGLLRQRAVSQIMPILAVTPSKGNGVVQQLLTAFRKLFQEPPTLPPSRPQDHQIPLLPGAQPVQCQQGSANLEADALSRQHTSISIVQPSTVQPVWMENFQAGYDDDAQARTLLTELKLVVQDFVAQCQVCQKVKTEQVVRAQQRINMQADKRLSERTLPVGDHLFLNLQLHMQQSVEARGNQKLPFKYCGPFKILQRVGEVAYKLQLPPSSHIHPVVHVSQLKRHVPANAQEGTIWQAYKSYK